MRQGSDQPFNVTTGLYVRPLGGVSGACVAAPVIIGASGSEAAPTRLTTPAPTSAASPVKKSLRDTMFIPFLMSCAARRWRGAAQRRTACAAAIDRSLQIGF